MFVIDNQMTDNYQFDKNSKLFQKFLALKANKTNESMTQKPHQADPIQSSTPKNRQEHHKQKSSHEVRGEASINQSFVGARRGPVHVTIDDIEEAAIESLEGSRADRQQNRRKEVKRQANCQEYTENVVEGKGEVQRIDIDLVREGQVVGVPLRNQRVRERRARDFQQRPKGRTQFRQENNFVRPAEEFTNTASGRKGSNEVGLRFEQMRLEREKENVEINAKDQDVGGKVEEINFTLGSKENEYKRKFQKVNQKYQQMKETLQQERKDKNNLLNQKDSQIELIKQKYFQVRSNQDTLTTELKRYKDKLQSENLARTKFEEEVKQLNFRILQLEDMLQGKQSNYKKKSDEINHWKTQNEQIRSEMKHLLGQIQTLEERCQFLQSQNKILQRQINNKQHLVVELRKNIGTIIEQNNIAKDQIYKLTIRLYHMEHQNMSIRGDLQRRDKDQPHHMSTIQDNYLRSIQSFSPKKSKQLHQRSDTIPQRHQGGARDPANGRRRQFARERATTKPQRPERPERPQRMHERQQRRQRRPIEPERNQQSVQLSGHSQLAARIQYLQAELQVRSKQKAMSGKMRKQKIDMQRELQQLLNQ